MVEYDDPPTQYTELRARKGDGQIVPTMTVLEGPELGAFYAFDAGKRAHRIGRADDADIRIMDPSVSRVHAICIISSRGSHYGVRITDNQSTNGVMVNARSVDECSLVSGDKIRLGDVLLRFEWMAEEEIRYHSDVSDQIRKAERDHLTGLLSRSVLDSRVPRVLEEADRRKQAISLMLVDLDHFKRVNDEFGHLVGDAVVQRTGRILRSSLRESDFGVRYGGEELLVIMPGTNLSEGDLVARRVREAVERLDLSDLASGLVVTVSIGLAERKVAEDVTAWIERADEALYDAKRAGRNRIAHAREPELSVDSTIDTDRAMAPMGDETSYRSTVNIAHPWVDEEGS